MTYTSLKSQIKKANRSMARAELDLQHARKIAQQTYSHGKDDPDYWKIIDTIARRLLGLKENASFKMFLEAAVGVQPEYTPVDLEHAVEIIRTHCKDAMWMIKDNKPIFRGDSNITQGSQKTGFITVDPSKTVRKSENTYNYYTTIFDNTPSCKNLPKRSRSFICSTNYNVAKSFGDGMNPLRVIPYDDVRIGSTEKTDMWETRIKIFGSIFPVSVNRINGRLKRISDIDADDWQSFVDFDRRLKNNDTAAIASFTEAFGPNLTDGNQLIWPAISAYAHSFLEEIDKAFSPLSTQHLNVTTKTLRHIWHDGPEVWVGGPLLMVTKTGWTQLQDAL
jgi:hypothetical protein